LLDGAYDEEEQAKGFQDAIMAWRNAGKDKTESETPTKEADKPKKGVRFAENEGGLPKAGVKLTVAAK
jgi:hypothetical protein